MAVERIIGVDFGTSTSVIRVKRYENGNPIGEKLETKEVIFGGNGAMVPTLIMKKDDDPSVCYFGFEAQQKKKKFSNFHSFKMDLESCDPSVRAQARLLTEEFYGYLAKQYKSQSEGGHLGNPDDKERTIISYPVKWSEETKNFMLETAKKAGFPNVAGMDEAQAAIQAVIVMSTDHLQKHGLLKNGVGANILLIDMGAGTTDLVLARYVPGEKPKTEVLNTWPKSGDIQFGGREIDDRLQNFFRGLLDEDDAEMVFRRIGSDKFKSWKEETVSPALRKSDSVSDFEVFDSCIEMMGIDMEDYCLDRAAFENCLADYLKQFPVLIDGCLQNVGMSGSDVDLVIVTGGHSQWYFVNEMLSGRMPQFGALNLPKIQENPARIIPISRPQETVALGLAYSGIHFDLSASTADDVQDRKKVMENLVHTLHAVKEQKHDQTKEAGQKEPVHTHTDSVGQSAPETEEQMRARMIEEVRRRSAAAQAAGESKCKAESANSLTQTPSNDGSRWEGSFSAAKSTGESLWQNIAKQRQKLQETVSGAGKNTYTIPRGKSIDGAVKEIINYLKSKKMEVQYLQNENCHVIQARTPSNMLKKVTGGDKAVEVRLTVSNGNQVKIEVGGGKWIVKSAGTTISILMTGPLMPIALATYGTNLFMQGKIIDDVQKIAIRYFSE